MKLIRQFLKAMYTDGAVVFPAVPMLTIQKACMELVKNKVPKIPNDYISFLTEVNGLYYQGVYLFGLNEQEREKGAFMHPGIMQNYVRYSKNPTLQGTIVIGLGHEELIAYCAAAKEYRLISNYDFQIILRFPRFIDVLYHYMGDLLD